jgi:hypothetical protein
VPLLLLLPSLPLLALIRLRTFTELLLLLLFVL